MPGLYRLQPFPATGKAAAKKLEPSAEQKRACLPPAFQPATSCEPAPPSPAPVARPIPIPSTASSLVRRFRITPPQPPAPKAGAALTAKTAAVEQRQQEAKAEAEAVSMCGSSGSQHTAAATAVRPWGTACLDQMVNDFLLAEGEDECTQAEKNKIIIDENENENEKESSKEVLLEDCDIDDSQLDEIIQSVATCCSSEEDPVLYADVITALEEIRHCNNNDNNSNDGLHRGLMTRLRAKGYNAAVCKSYWDHSSGGLAAGNYEYVDVVIKKGAAAERVIIDVDLRSQFEIARADRRYTRLLEAVPKVFVGRQEQLKHVLKTMCEAAKRSLTSQGLDLPPWRKWRYVQRKWLSSYRRTCRDLPSNPTPLAVSTCCIALKSSHLTTHFTLQVEESLFSLAPPPPPPLHRPLVVGGLSHALLLAQPS